MTARFAMATSAGQKYSSSLMFGSNLSSAFRKNNMKSEATGIYDATFGKGTTSNINNLMQRRSEASNTRISVAIDYV